MDLQGQQSRVGPRFEQLSTLDAEFLHLEDTQSPMHIAGLCIFEGPALSRVELEQLIAAALERVPRYRMRLHNLPLSLGRPVWVEDPAFAVSRHVHVVSVGAESGPTGENGLNELMAQLLSQPLDRRRPLWDAWLVHGLAGGRWALIARAHHAMVDGISGMGLLRVLLDEKPEADPTLRGPSEWRPSALPSTSLLLRGAAVRLAQDVAGAGRALLHGLRDPAYGVRTTAAVVTGLTRFGFRLYSRRSSSLQGTIGARRRYAYRVVTMSELVEIRRAFGCTLNDVVLTLLSGGYRALLLALGDRVEQAHVRSLVPVSVRGRDEVGQLDNRVSAVFYNLPVRLADPAQRLQAVMRQMVRLKHAHMVEAGVWFTHAGDFVPPLLVSSVSRIVAHVMHRHPQRVVSTVTTNVPGPRMPLYILGRRLVHWLPHVPITQGARLGCACLSYGDELAFGVTADYASIPDLSVFTSAIVKDLGALLAHARAAAQPRAEEL